MCWFSGHRFSFSRSRHSLKYCGGFFTYLRKPLVWFHILLLPLDVLISIQLAFIPDLDSLHWCKCNWNHHDRSLTHDPSAQWSRCTLTAVHAGFPARFGHLPETKRPPLLHDFCICTKCITELHFCLATLYIDVCRHMAPCGIPGCRRR